MHPPVNRVILSKLPVQCIVNLKKVQVIKAGIQPFIALIIRAAMQHSVIDNPFIVPKKNFSEEQEIRLYRVTKMSKLPHEIFI